jgi:hypothetical protein
VNEDVLALLGERHDLQAEVGDAGESGDVHYYGDPALTRHVDGSGDVSHANAENADHQRPGASAGGAGLHRR